MRDRSQRNGSRIAIALAVLALGIAGCRADTATESSSVKQVRFTNTREQAAQFIRYYHSIELSPEQEKIKEQALSSIPAPCCSNYSIARCCCPCNLAKSVWGLSHLLIATHGYGAAQVEQDVRRWITFTNEDGYTGNACYKGGCARPFHENGCGGMNEKWISF